MHDRNPENAYNFVSQLIVSLIDSYQQRLAGAAENP